MDEHRDRSHERQTNGALVKAITKLENQNAYLKERIRILEVELKDTERRVIKGLELDESRWECPGCVILKKEVSSVRGWLRYYKEYSLPVADKQRRKAEKKHKKASKLIGELKHDLAKAKETSDHMIGLFGNMSRKKAALESKNRDLTDRIVALEEQAMTKKMEYTPKNRQDQTFDNKISFRMHKEHFEKVTNRGSGSNIFTEETVDNFARLIFKYRPDTTIRELYIIMMEMELEFIKDLGICPFGFDVVGHSVWRACGEEQRGDIDLGYFSKLELEYINKLLGINLEHEEPLPNQPEQLSFDFMKEGDECPEN